VIRLLCGGDRRQAEVQASPAGLRVTVDGEAFQMEVEEVGPASYVYRRDGRTEVFHCLREEGVIHLFWRGAAYRLEEEGEAARAAHRPSGGGLEAPMPGRVIAVKAGPGQAVSKGDEIVVVESMKMENGIRAPRAGVVKSVAVRVGDMVGPGMVLAELE